MSEKSHVMRAIIITVKAAGKKGAAFGRTGIAKSQCSCLYTSQLQSGF